MALVSKESERKIRITIDEAKAEQAIQAILEKFGLMTTAAQKTNVVLADTNKKLDAVTVAAKKGADASSALFKLETWKAAKENLSQVVRLMWEFLDGAAKTNTQARELRDSFIDIGKEAQSAFTSTLFGEHGLGTEIKSLTGYLKENQAGIGQTASQFAILVSWIGKAEIAASGLLSVLKGVADFNAGWAKAAAERKYGTSLGTGAGVGPGMTLPKPSNVPTGEVNFSEAEGYSDIILGSTKAKAARGGGGGSGFSPSSIPTWSGQGPWMMQDGAYALGSPSTPGPIAPRYYGQDSASMSALGGSLGAASAMAGSAGGEASRMLDEMVAAKDKYAGLYGINSDFATMATGQVEALTAVTAGWSLYGETVGAVADNLLAVVKGQKGAGAALKAIAEAGFSSAAKIGIGEGLLELGRALAAAANPLTMALAPGHLAAAGVLLGIGAVGLGGSAAMSAMSSGGGGGSLASGSTAPSEGPSAGTTTVYNLYFTGAVVGDQAALGEYVQGSLDAARMKGLLP